MSTPVRHTRGERLKKPLAECWQTSKQISGVSGMLRTAIEECTAQGGNFVCINPKLAEKLLIICAQAKHTEVGHGQ